MAKPGLKLVDANLSDRCGAPTSDGSPCMRQTGGERCFDHEDQAVPPPEHLGEIGRKEWARRVEQFDGAGVLDQIDRGLLEAACEVYEEARRCRAVVERHGRLIKGRTGMKKNPAHAKMLKFRKEYRLTIGDILKGIDAANAKIDEGDPFASADF